MTERYRFAGMLACAMLVGVALIVFIQKVNLPGGISKVVRPAEAGVGTKCAQGDRDSCEKLCQALSNISTIKCIDHLARVFPKVHDGSQVGGNSAPSSGSSGSPSGAGQTTTGVAGSPSIFPPPSGGSGTTTVGGGTSGSGPPTTGSPGPTGPPGSPGPTGPPGGSGGGDSGGGNVNVCVQNPLLPTCVKVHTPPLPNLP